jgi:hypothetical protein
MDYGVRRSPPLSFFSFFSFFSVFLFFFCNGRALLHADLRSLAHVDMAGCRAKKRKTRRERKKAAVTAALQSHTSPTL